LIDNSNEEFENTISGTLVITEVNTSSKIVKGTFQFTTSNNVEDAVPVVNMNVTNGTFRYKYED
jgi:hypothetical protein